MVPALQTRTLDLAGPLKAESGGGGWGSIKRLDSIGIGHFSSVFEFHFAGRRGAPARKPAEDSSY